MQLNRTYLARKCTPGNLVGFWSRLFACIHGVATTEFALILPVFITLSMYGTELAYMQTVSLQVGQMATSTADNASRIGQTSNSAVTPTVSEQDVNSIMFGARKQGASFAFNQNGRLILTSLEVDPSTNKQWIHWQRCTGTKTTYTSAYGNDTTQNGLNGAALTGMGGSSKITASSGQAVMYVEVIYQYHGLFGTLFVNNPTIRKEAAFLTRDRRNLTPGVTGTGGTSSCT